MSRGSSLLAVLALAGAVTASAHSGPPFPALANHVAGAYDISIWTDPDTTDDGSAGGQFWVLLKRAGGGEPVPAGTAVTVAIQPLDRQGPALTALAAPVGGAIDNQFAALLMDHEGRYAVRVTVEGPLGRAGAGSTVAATYDLRPPRGLVLVYLLPFVAIGALWIKVLLRRRRTARS